MTDRPLRRRLVPAWLLPSILAILLVITAGVLLARATFTASLVTVPDLHGRSADVAAESVHLTGLLFETAGQQFSSDVPEGAVISQVPAAGARVRRGSSVGVIVSAGSESVSMPDLVGLSLQDARKRLRALGLGVTTTDVLSEASAGTVLETYPASGASVRTGTLVRLTVAIGGIPDGSLLPYDLSGMVIALDPAPVSGDASDVPLDVSRRLRSLLEASGATVTVTRSVTETAPPEASRAAVVSSARSIVSIGLSFSASGVPGLTAVAIRSDESTVTQSAQTLAQAFISSVRVPGQVVNAVRSGTDVVLGSDRSPAFRVLVGDPGNASDAVSFKDPEWADAIARALYRAVGESFAPR